MLGQQQDSPSARTGTIEELIGLRPSIGRGISSAALYAFVPTYLSGQRDAHLWWLHRSAIVQIVASGAAL